MVLGPVLWDLYGKVEAARRYKLSGYRWALQGLLQGAGSVMKDFARVFCSGFSDVIVACGSV